MRLPIHGLVLWALLASGCDASVECEDRSDCGDGQVCDGGTCLVVACASSRDCNVHEYCDDAYTCVAGCADDLDCFGGESCSTSEQQCFPNECRTTALDCKLGQTCDADSGDCVDEDACQVCTAGSEGECGTGQCETFTSGATTGDYCILPCAIEGAEDQCPRGLDCVDLSGAGDLYCYADCPVFLAEKTQAAEAAP